MQQDHDSNAILTVMIIPEEPKDATFASCFDVVRHPIYPSVSVSTVEMDKLLLDLEMTMIAFQKQYRWIQFRAGTDQAQGFHPQTVSENFDHARGKLMASDPRFPTASFLYDTVVNAISDPILTGTLNRAKFGEDVQMLRAYVQHRQPDFALDPMGELFVVRNAYGPRLENTARYLGMDAPVQAVINNQAYALYKCQLR